LKLLSLFFIVLGSAIFLIKEFCWEKSDNNLAPKKEVLNEEIRLKFLVILFIAMSRVSLFPSKNVKRTTSFPS